MATIKCTVGQRSDWYEVYFEYSYTQDTAKNQTNLTHALKLKQLTNSGDFNTVGEVTVSYRVGGVTFSKKAVINIDDKGNTGYTITLASGTSTLTHDATGVGSFKVSVDTSIDSGGYGPGRITLSERTVSLPTIHRASAPSIKNIANAVITAANMGETVYIHTGGASSSFTHTIKYDFGPVKGATIKTGVGASCDWRVPDLAQYCPNATRGVATITCITYNGSTKLGEQTCSITLNVPTASIPTATAVVMGNKVTVNTNRKSANFTHKVTWSFGSKSGTASNNATTSAEFTAPLDLAKEIKDKPSGEGTITCVTYNGTAEVGTKICAFTATVPNDDTTKPKAVWTTTPVDHFEGQYIQGKSKVSADYFDVSSDYSTIASYAMTVEGKTYAGDPATSEILTKSGDVEVKGIVTDARGYSRELKETIYVVPYSTPYIEPAGSYRNIVCERSKSDGTYDDEGNFLHIVCSVKHSPVMVDTEDKNIGSLWLSVNGTVTKLLDATNDSIIDEVVGDCVEDPTKAYAVKLIAKDSVGSSESYDFTIPTADVALHLANGGRGVAVGKYATEQDTFEIAEDWDFKMKGDTVADFVVEQGTSGNWEYRKWHSGNVEAWCLATNVNGAYADSLEVPSETSLYFPFDIYSAQPNLTLTGNHWEVKKYYANTVTDTSMKIICYTEGSLLLTDISCAVHINGKWK